MKSIKLVTGRGGTMDAFSKRSGLLLAPAPSPAPAIQKIEHSTASADMAEDTLDAFLAELNGESAIATSVRATGATAVPLPEPLEQSEAGEGFVAHLDAAYDEEIDKMEGEGRGELLYDSDGDVIGVARGSAPAASKEVAPLPLVDHSTVVYTSFERCFYAPVSEVAALTSEEIDAARAEAGIVVSGAACPAPVSSFMHLCLDGSLPALVIAISRAGFEAPTGIQSQALPALLSGRDVIGIAQTGSGKTLAYALPAIRHAAAQRPLSQSEGPIALIIAPTRELSTQVIF